MSEFIHLNLLLGPLQTSAVLTDGPATVPELTPQLVGSHQTFHAV